jgi:hypothetical protein
VSLVLCDGFPEFAATKGEVDGAFDTFAEDVRLQGWRRVVAGFW